MKPTINSRKLTALAAFALVVALSVSAHAQDWKASYEAGEAALDAGNHAQARTALKAALKASEGFDAADARRIQTQTRLGDALAASNMNSAARIQFESALAGHAKAKRRDNIAAALVYNRIGNVEQSLGNKPKALAAYETALKTLDASGDRFRFEAATVRANLAGVLRTSKGQGSQIRAEKLLVRALADKEATAPKGKDDPALVSALNGLGLLYLDTRRAEQAIPLLKRALTLTAASEPTGGRKTATTLHNIGYAYDRSGDAAKARDYYLKALPMREAALGPSHKHVGTTCNNLGAAYTRLDAPAKGLPLLKRALAIREAIYGKGHARVRRTLKNLEIAQRKLGDTAAADELKARIDATSRSTKTP